MKKKHEGAVFVCGHCLTSTHWSGAVPSAPDRWADLRLWRSECRTHPLVGGSPTTHGRWEPLHGGQGGISLEYQTYTSAYLFDTQVSGLPPPTYVLRNSRPCLNNTQYYTPRDLRNPTLTHRSGML